MHFKGKAFKNTKYIKLYGYFGTNQNLKSKIYVQVQRSESRDSDMGTRDLNVVIRPKEFDSAAGLAMPILAPPPRSSQSSSIYCEGKLL